MKIIPARAKAPTREAMILMLAVKILMIYPQIDAPLGTNHGIASLAGVLHANGHVLDLMHVSEKYRPVPSSDEIIAYIRETGPGLVGFSVMSQQYDWVVVTSANGAAQVAGALSQTNIRPKLAAVGKASADALGVEVDFVPTIARGDELVAQFPRGSGRVLLAQAQDAGGAVADGLRARGYVVDAVAAYATEIVVPSSDDMELAQRADAVVFYSGSAVRSWCV